MSILSWEDIFIEERIAQRKRDSYLDMRNAHKLAKVQIDEENTGKVEYKTIYKEIFEGLSVELHEGLSGKIRKRSTNVW